MRSSRVLRRFESVKSVLCEKVDGVYECNVDGSSVLVSDVDFSRPRKRMSEGSWFAVDYGGSGYCYLEDDLLRCSPGRRPKFPVRPVRALPVRESIAPSSFRPERLNVRYAW